MTLIDEKKALELYSSVQNSIQSSGGSAANTLTGIAQLGGKAAFIGRVRNDKLGNIFTNDIRAAGATFNTPPAVIGPSTARCMVFVTPDAERTMCTFLGTSSSIDSQDIDFSIVKDSNILYLEGYLWDNDLTKKAFIKASNISKENGGEVALSLSDPFCVDRHRKSFQELIDGHIDILFANEDEIKSLYEVSTLEEAIQSLGDKCDIAAITMGAEGSIIITKDNKLKINSYNFGPVIDTTGAGDIYAGGFLYGYTKGSNLMECGKIGSICAGHIVTILGPRSNTSLENILKSKL